MTSIIMWADIFRLSNAAEEAFSIRVERVEPLLEQRERFFGEATLGRTIRLRVHRKGRPKRPLSPRTIIDTLAHELAHCKMFELYGWEHREGKEFQEWKQRIMTFWKESGMI